MRLEPICNLYVYLEGIRRGFTTWYALLWHVVSPINYCVVHGKMCVAIVYMQDRRFTVVYIYVTKLGGGGGGEGNFLQLAMWLMKCSDL